MNQLYHRTVKTISFSLYFLIFSSALILTPAAAQTIARPILTAISTSTSEIQLNWSDSNTNVKSYLVQRSLKSGSGFTNLVSLSGTIKSFKDSGLTTNTTYYYKVRATVKNTNGPFSVVASAKTMAVVTVPSGHTLIDVKNIYADSGFASAVYSGMPALCDSVTNPTASSVQIYENGRALGPAHSLHSDIRTLGLGRFSHWCFSDGSAGLIFSASDNSRG